MKLLIVTQVMDENDPVLGFFCRWVEEFAKHFEKITVIAFRAGEYHLPENVVVHSLGKEKGAKKLPRVARFVSLVVSLRNEYTHVFAHMSPEYVIAAGWFWKINGKKVALWYNHTKKSMRLFLASTFCRIIFHTSPYAAPSRFGHALRMPAGIDTALFSPQPIQKEPKRAYFQGRVAPAKHVGEICEAIQILHRTDTDVSLAIVGPEDLTYAERLKNDYGELIEMHALFFLGPKKTSQTPPLYAQARVAINLTAEGNYDKTVLEAMACGTLPIVGSKAFSDMIPSEWVVHPEDTAALSEKIERAFSLPDNDYASLTKAFREVVIARHDVGVLGTKVAEAFRGL